MTKLDKAEAFYLRGFNSAYIKRRTGISMQSLLKQLLSRGIKYSKQDIINYQISYIKGKYSPEEIEASYLDMISKTDNPDKQKRGKHIVMLGCGFGEYPKVIAALIGGSRYKELKTQAWQTKQTHTVREKYGVDNVFDKSTFHTFVTDDAVIAGRAKRTATMLQRYGVAEPWQDADIKTRMLNNAIATNMKRYGVKYAPQRKEVAEKIVKARQDTMFAKYGHKNSVEIESIKQSIFESRSNNHTQSTSRPEVELGRQLRELFGEDDIIYNEIIDERYPYHVDYYVKSLDLFIELNGDRCHHNHWFDETDPDDVNTLSKWETSMARIEAETGKQSRYRNFIRVWAGSDVEKRTTAKEQDLNYLVLWDGTCNSAGPKLTDFHEWVDDGCPNPHEWKIKNTF